MKKKPKIKKKSSKPADSMNYDLGGFAEGAMSMGMAGSALGPWGAIGGALIGGITGSLTADKQQEQLNAAQKRQSEYEQRIAEMNSIYKQPGGYNQQTPGATPPMFEGGGKVPERIIRIALANDDTYKKGGYAYNKGGGVKLIKGSGKDGSVKKVHKGDFVVPNPSIPEFVSQTGMKPTGVVTAKSKGDTKIIAGEGNKPELLVKKETAKKIPNIQKYAPNAKPGNKKQTGGPAGPLENQTDFAYDFSKVAGQGTDMSDLLKKQQNPTVQPEQPSLYNPQGPEIPGKKMEYSLSTLNPGTVGGDRSLKVDIANQSLNLGTANLDMAQQGLPNTPFVDKNLGKEMPISLANTKIAPPAAQPAAQATTNTPKAPVDDMTRVNRWSNYMNVANAALLLNNLMQTAPQIKEPSLFMPQLEDRTGQIMQDKKTIERDVDRTIAGAQSARQAAGITYDTDLVAKSINANVKIGEATDKAFADQAARNTEIMNNASLYNLEAKNQHNVNQFNLQNQFQHEKAAQVSQALSNVGTIMHTKAEAIHHLNAEHQGNSTGKWQQLVSFGLSTHQLPGQPANFDEFSKLTPAQQDEWIAKAQKAKMLPQENKTLTNSSLAFNSIGLGLGNQQEWMSEPVKF